MNVPLVLFDPGVRLKLAPAGSGEAVNELMALPSGSEAVTGNVSVEPARGLGAEGAVTTGF